MRSNNSLPLSATDMFSGGTETGRVDEDGGATSAAAAAAAAVSSTASSGFTSSMTISISSSSSFFADAAPPQINRRQIDKGYSTHRVTWRHRTSLRSRCDRIVLYAFRNQNSLSTNRPSFAAANHVVTLTRVTNERVGNWVDLLQVSSVHVLQDYRGPGPDVRALGHRPRLRQAARLKPLQ